MPRTEVFSNPGPDVDRHGIPDPIWQKLLKYSAPREKSVSQQDAARHEKNVSQLVSDVRKIAERWALAKAQEASPPAKLDAHGRAALEALEVGFRRLAASKSQPEMGAILSKICPQWDRTFPFYLTGGEEHDAASPRELAYEIAEFLALRPQHRPRRDDAATQDVATGLIASWTSRLRRPPRNTTIRKSGSIYAFYEALLPHIRPSSPTLREPHRRARRRGASIEIQPLAQQEQSPPSLDFSGECLPALKRAIKRHADRRRATRKPAPAVTRSS